MKIQPIAETEGTITLSRADYDALLGELEDARDVARLRTVEARLTAGETEELPFEMVERQLAGEHPLRVWREHRGLSLAGLSEKSGVPSGYMSEIETGKKPGSVRAFRSLADALGVTVDDLVPPQSDDRHT